LLTPNCEKYIHWVQAQKQKLISESLSSRVDEQDGKRRAEEELLEKRWEVGSHTWCLYGMLGRFMLTMIITETHEVPFLVSWSCRDGCTLILE